MTRIPLALFTLLVLAVSSLPVGAQTDPYYGRIGTSMEAFGSVFREITTDYVDQTDPQEVINAGIKGMLSTLDPYSVYMQGDESESLDRLSTGSYVGFGFTIGRRNGQLTFLSVRPGYSAWKSGIRRGDRLVSIDGTRVDTMHVDSLRPLSKGADGSSATFRIFRQGLPDTLSLNISRSNIPVENIDLTTKLEGNIGYLRLAQFSRTSARDLRDTLQVMMHQHVIEGLIIDVRGNPGGLLEAATDIASIFLPKNSLIVSTVDRSGRRREYRSQNDPQAPSLPLAILIDDHSASASEILAAAIQDHDRGIVIGETSFGKGLVQTVVPLPHDATLKMTTARYYTPSGRCLQRGIRHDKQQVDSGVFVTRSGRLVRASNGVTPDSAVKQEVFHGAIAHLDSTGVVMDFATEVAARLTSLPEGYTVNARTVADFHAYLLKQPSTRRNALLAELETVKLQATTAQMSRNTLLALEQARQAMDRELMSDLKRHTPELTLLLDAEIHSRFGSEAVRGLQLLSIDPSVRTARELLTSGGYHTFLGGGSDQDQ